jgi:hypothetical protein
MSLLQPPFQLSTLKKKLPSNWVLTVFVRQLVDLVKQVPIVCPQGRKECFTGELCREIETAAVFSVFVHYHQQNNALRCFLSFHKIYMSHKVYGAQKSASSTVPVHASTRVLSLTKASPLVAFECFTERVIVDLQAVSL